jgi:hypothetical protein
MSWQRDADATDENEQKDYDIWYERMPLDQPEATLKQWMTRAVKSFNMHRHTHTCKKGSHHGDHWDCRMAYDRPLVPFTHANLTNLQFLVRRTLGHLVPYIPGLMLACPGNHTMSMTMEFSRWLREHCLWKDAQVLKQRELVSLTALGHIH